MGTLVSELQRMGLKFFLDGASAVRPREFVPVFHRWIQTRAVADLLIDVADYEHVPDGPGVVLVAHEGNYAVDLGGGRMGLLYTRKSALPGALPDRLRALARLVLTASRLLETDPQLGGRARVRGDEFELFANDRLRAPNGDETRAAFQPAVAELIRTLYGGAACTITAERDPRERLSVRVKAPAPVDIQTLLARLG